jgi:hypothetical protein
LPKYWSGVRAESGTATNLQETAAKAARWLGYIPFEQISDRKNPSVYERHADGRNLLLATTPNPILRVVPEIYLPDDMTPRVELDDFMPRQKHHLVFFGEKDSLGEVLGPLAETYKACLYLPTGEITDTLLAVMARNGVRDGRPMVVFIFADFDPSGSQMAVSIGHKLRCLKEAFYPDLEFTVVVPALTVEQVTDLGLPSTPLKATEKRADKWRLAHGGRLVRGSIDAKGKLSADAVVEGGLEQTEIDSLATLRPDDLRRIVRRAVKPYWDASLEDRARRARDEWEAAAQAAFEEQVDPARMATLQAQAEEAIENLKARLADLSLATEDLEIDWPEVEMPEAECAGDGPSLVNSDMDLTEAIQILRARKRYENGASE